MQITKKLGKKTTRNLTNCSSVWKFSLSCKFLTLHKPDSQVEQAQFWKEKGNKKVFVNQENFIVPNIQSFSGNIMGSLEFTAVLVLSIS